MLSSHGSAMFEFDAPAAELSAARAAPTMGAWISSCSSARSPTPASPPSAPARCGRGPRAARSGYEAMTDVPAALRARLADEVPFSTLTVVEEAHARDGTVKTLFHTADGRAVEAVLCATATGAARCVCPRSRAAR